MLTNAIRWSLVTILALTAIGASFAAVPFEDMNGGLTVGDVAPDGTVTPLGAPAITLSAYQGNTPMLLVFFRTVCPHCQKEVAQIKQAFASLDATKVKVLALSIWEDAALVAQFKTSYGITYPLAADPRGTCQRPFNVKSVPTYFILDGERKVRFQGHKAPAQQLIDQLNSLVPAAH